MQSNQTSSQQRGFFTLWAFALQSWKNHGLQYFCPDCRTGLRFSKSLLMLLPPHIAYLFFLLSPEAFLLTGDGTNSTLHHIIASYSVAISINVDWCGDNTDQLVKIITLQHRTR